MNGAEVGFNATFDPVDVGQRTQVSVLLPADVGDRITIVFRRPEVAIAGPWRLIVPVPSR